MTDPGTHQRRRYPTLSLYEGLYDPNRQCMHGYGRYMYADGSEYRGYFQNGKFHGFGRLRLAPPYKFTFKGTFERGKLVSIEEMGFSDGLSVIGEIKDGGLDTSDWVYCVPSDRRFCNEMNEGLQAVGPNFQITRQRPARQLPPGSFDAEEGVFKPHSGFLFHIPAPFSPSRFVGCETEAAWIMENCRYQFPEKDYDTKRSTGLSLIDRIVIRKEPNEYFSRLIMRANIEGDSILDDHKAERSIATKVGGRAKEYLRNLCPTKTLHKNIVSGREQKCTPSSSVCSDGTGEISNVLVESTTTQDSFEERSLSNDLSEKICAKHTFDIKGSSITMRNSIMKDARSYHIHFGFR